MNNGIIKFEKGCVTMTGKFSDIMTNLTFIYAAAPDLVKKAWNEVPKAYKAHKEEIEKNSVSITPEFIKKINEEV